MKMKELDLELIKRNTEETIGLESLKLGDIAYCGYEPSGLPHLGHLLTVQKLIDLQNAGLRTKVLLADLHGKLNKKENIERGVELYKKIFSAFGYKGEFVIGSSFQLKPQYFEDVMTLAQNISLDRGRRTMSEIARDFENATVAQILYPLMQVADFKHLNVSLGLGGMEQRKVQVLALETLPKIGYKKPALVHTPLFDSLKGPDTKMSSSIPGSMISAMDNEETVNRAISKAFLEPNNKRSAVLQIIQYFIFPRFGSVLDFNNYEDLEKAYLQGKIDPAKLKNICAEKINEILEPIRRKVRI
jgi:tyrosyl-tRNA synthetase